MSILKKLGNQKIRGTIETNYKGGQFYAFKGIPYAEPPLGPLRFKAPKPLQIPDEKHSEEVFDATQDPNYCYQYNYIKREWIGSEDCLYLNIYTSIDNGNGNKPVMVYIHGGGFVNGTCRSDFFGPEHLMTMDHLILITINYRLGLLGFLSLADPDLGVGGNAGIKDCLLALEWIQNNIGEFNGDPDNITVFGCSAGAAIIHYLILSERTRKGLFQRAILQSGCALNPWAQGQMIQTPKIFQKTNCQDLKQLLQHLRSISVEQLLEYQMEIDDSFDANLRRFVVPVIEYPTPDAIITKDPFEIIKSGQYHHVPMIFGYVTGEGLFCDTLKTFRKTQIFNQIQANLPHNLHIPTTDLIQIKSKLMHFYFHRKPDEVMPTKSDDFYKLIGDTYFILGLISSIRTHQMTNTKPIYLYEMNLESDLNPSKAIFMEDEISGCAHADELGYLFMRKICKQSTIPLDGSDEDIYIQRFVKLWTNFAKFNIPILGDSNKQMWLPVEMNHLRALKFGTELRMDEDYKLERIDFWHKLLGPIAHIYNI